MRRGSSLRVEVVDASERAPRHEDASVPDGRVVEQEVPDHQDRLALRARAARSLALLDRGGEGLLDQHVTAAASAALASGAWKGLGAHTTTAWTRGSSSAGARESATSAPGAKARATSRRAGSGSATWSRRAPGSAASARTWWRPHSPHPRPRCPRAARLLGLRAGLGLVVGLRAFWIRSKTPARALGSGRSRGRRGPRRPCTRARRRPSRSGCRRRASTRPSLRGVRDGVDLRLAGVGEPPNFFRSCSSMSS